MSGDDPAVGPAGDGLVDTWVEDGRRTRPQPRVLPPPSAPLAVAREFVEDRYSDEEGHRLRDHGGDFYRWNGTCWPELNLRTIRAETYTWLEGAVYEKMTRDGLVLEPWDPTRHKVDNVIDALRAVVHLEAQNPPLWNPVPAGALLARDMVSMANGLLHLPTRTVHPHTPSFFTHHSLPFDFDPATSPPRGWLGFLEELWQGDPTSIAALQEIFGYILGGGTRQQKIFLLVGPRRAGKGTIGRVLNGLLGPHNVAAPTMAALATNFGLQPLIGKPLALISDARLSGKADNQAVVERLLSISGEDSLTIDRKYREPWTGRLPTRFVVLTNELPRLNDSSGALVSRFVLLVLTESFLGKEDPLLTERLLEEATGIFNWSLEGLDRLNGRGYFRMPDSSRDALQELEDLSSPVSAFVRERCRIGAQEEVAVDRLWGAWKIWCEQENRHAGTKSVFGRNLKATAPSVRKRRPRDTDGDRTHVYAGIGIRPALVSGHRGRHDQDSLSSNVLRSGYSPEPLSSGLIEEAGHGGHGNIDPVDLFERESIREVM